jgi:catechol 2,3-dioxygenase-like lactoylglutathione lyase family enzyme
MIRALAVICGLLLAVPAVYGAPEPDSVDRIVIPVSRLDRAAAFYTGALSFTAAMPGASVGLVLRLGDEGIELVQRTGRAIPSDSRSNDGWFQHLAIVVSDIDRAWRIALQEGASPISSSPQSLPAWNPNAGGIRAVYFRDPDLHPLELIRIEADATRAARR